MIEENISNVVKDISNEISLLYDLKAHSNIITYEDYMIKEDGDSWHIFINGVLY